MILFRRTCRQADASLTILSAPDSVSEGELSAVLFACIAKVRPNVLMPPSLRAKASPRCIIATARTIDRPNP